jgi:hypothetical protein
MFVVEDHAGTQPTNAVASLVCKLTDLIVLYTAWAGRRARPIELLGIEIRHRVAFGADHII